MKRMVPALAIGLSLAAATACRADDVMTVDGALSTRKDPATVRFVLGMIRGMETTAAVAEYRRKVRIMCQPADMIFQYDQVMDMVARDRAKNPAAGTMPMVVVMVDDIMNTFPCK